MVVRHEFGTMFIESEGMSEILNGRVRRNEGQVAGDETDATDGVPDDVHE
jgi:hypothetical protein